MRSLEVTPCAPLQPFVRLLWLLEIDDPAESSPPQRIAPDGLVELVFHYRAPMVCRFDGEDFQRQARCVAISQTSRFLEFQATQATGLISVRFQPWGAYHFFRQPVSEFADRQIPCTELWGQAALETEERIAEAETARDRIAIVERFLLEMVTQHRKADIEPVVRTVWQHRGRISIPEICDELGIGERTLQRVCGRSLGMPPKRFVRLSRFLNACARLRSPDQTLTEIGLDCGYFDQSHFISEFRSFSGMTPRQFVQEESLSFLETD